MVLWILVLLTIIVGEFCYSMRTEVNITRNYKEKTEAYYSALAGLHFGLMEAVNIRTAETVNAGKSEAGIGTWRVNADIPGVNYHSGCFKVKIDNESGKININSADKATLSALLDSFQLTEQEKWIIVDSIMDWRDKNSFHRLNGAEDDYYLSLPEPYPCKDDDFDSIEELLQVRGVDETLYHNGLKKVFTVFSETKSNPPSSPKSTSNERQKINVNAAPPEVLMALPGMTEEIVSRIVDFRKKKDFGSLVELIPIMGTKPYIKAARYITLENSSYFTISAIGRSAGGGGGHAMKVMAKISPTARNKIHILKWWDQAEPF